jgi:hypothetical protein
LKRFRAVFVESAKTGVAAPADVVEGGLKPADREQDGDAR